jgi:hypothetical protein
MRIQAENAGIGASLGNASKHFAAIIAGMDDEHLGAATKDFRDVSY